MNASPEEAYSEDIIAESVPPLWVEHGCAGITMATVNNKLIRGNSGKSLCEEW